MICICLTHDSRRPTLHDMVIDGKRISQGILGELKKETMPGGIFAAILVGNDPASRSFLKIKAKIAKDLRIDFRVYEFPEKISNDKLRLEIGKLAKSKAVSGVIVQLPLPVHLNRHYVLNAIPRGKDVDVLGERALGAFYAGRNAVLPPSVGTFEHIISSQSVILGETTVVVVGLGLLVGRPIATWLMDKSKQIILLDKGSDLGLLLHADLVVSGVGRAGLIQPNMLKKGASVIDFGYSMSEHESADGTKLLCGDLDASGLDTSSSQLSFFTPTPNGTGPILVAKLFENFYRLASFHG